MDRSSAKRAIATLARDGKLALTQHAKDRAPEKGKYPLTLEQIRNCLIHGNIIEGPAPDLLARGHKDAWKFTVERLKAAERHIVAGVLIVETRILVITGFEWSKPVRRNPPLKSNDYDEDDS